jgi:restriction system protein
METAEHITPTTETLSEKHLISSGGYRSLRSFQLATIIYDATVSFCNRFVERRSYMHDQMVQAARSGRQKIAGAGRAADSTADVYLTTAARNNFDELLLDYEDFLRQRKLRLWVKNDSEAQAVYNVALKNERIEVLDPSVYAGWLEHKDPAVAANVLICLIQQADVLLARQAATLDRGPVTQDICSEQGASVRGAEKEVMEHPTDRLDTEKTPACKLCGRPMALRTARTGKSTGRSFWGCTGYPECKGTLPGKKSA